MLMNLQRTQLHLAVLKRATDAVLPHLPEKALSRAEQEARPHKTIAYTWDETYTLPENFSWLISAAGHSLPGLGKRFIYHEYYDALAETKMHFRVACVQSCEYHLVRDASLSNTW